VKKKFLYIALGLLIIINLTAFATLTYHRCCGKNDECKQMEVKDGGIFLCQQLSLSESQIKAMEVLSQNFHMHTDSINSALKIKRSELIKTLSESNPDIKKIESQIEEINDLQADLQKNVIQYLLEKKEKLTTDQQKKFFAILQERFNRQAQCKKSANLNFISTDCDTNNKQPTNCSNK